MRAAERTKSVGTLIKSRDENKTIASLINVASSRKRKVANAFLIPKNTAAGSSLSHPRNGFHSEIHYFAIRPPTTPLSRFFFSID